MIQIALIVSGKEQIYRAAGMNLKNSLTAYELYKEYSQAEGDFSDELIEKCLLFVTGIFGGAFTREQLLEGYKGSAFILFPNMLRACVSYVNEEIVNFPEPATAPEMKTKRTKS